MVIYRGEFVNTSAGPNWGRSAPAGTAMFSRKLKGNTMSSKYEISYFNRSGSFKRCEKWYYSLKSDDPNLPPQIWWIKTNLSFLFKGTKYFFVSEKRIRKTLYPINMIAPLTHSSVSHPLKSIWKNVRCRNGLKL